MSSWIANTTVETNVSINGTDITRFTFSKRPLAGVLASLLYTLSLRCGANRCATRETSGIARSRARGRFSSERVSMRNSQRGARRSRMNSQCRPETGHRKGPRDDLNDFVRFACGTPSAPRASIVGEGDSDRRGVLAGECELGAEGEKKP